MRKGVAATCQQGLSPRAQITGVVFDGVDAGHALNFERTQKLVDAVVEVGGEQEGVVPVERGDEARVHLLDECVGREVRPLRHVVRFLDEPEALRLIQKDKVDILVGGTGSHVYLALEKLADQYKKIVVCTGATSDDLTGKGFSRYFFRPGITNTNTTFSIAKYLAKQPYTKYYSIHQDYAFGHDMARIFREKLTALNPNAKIVGEDFTPVGNKDYNPYLSKIAASGAEVVFVSHIGGDGQVLLKQAAEMGLTKQKQFALFYYDSITAELLGESLEGAIVTHSYGITIDSPLNRAFIKRYHERHKKYPSTHMQYPDSFFGNAYFGMMFLFAAIEKARSLDPEKIIKAWELSLIHISEPTRPY